MPAIGFHNTIYKESESESVCYTPCDTIEKAGEGTRDDCRGHPTTDNLKKENEFPDSETTLWLFGCVSLPSLVLTIIPTAKSSGNTQRIYSHNPAFAHLCDSIFFFFHVPEAPHEHRLRKTRNPSAARTCNRPS